MYASVTRESSLTWSGSYFGKWLRGMKIFLTEAYFYMILNHCFKRNKPGVMRMDTYNKKTGMLGETISLKSCSTEGMVSDISAN